MTRPTRSDDDEGTQAAEPDAAADSEFESYYDTDSGHWSLRRIPSAPPPADGDDAVP